MCNISFKCFSHACSFKIHYSLNIVLQVKQRSPREKQKWYFNLGWQWPLRLSALTHFAILPSFAKVTSGGLSTICLIPCSTKSMTDCVKVQTHAEWRPTVCIFMWRRVGAHGRVCEQPHGICTHYPTHHACPLRWCWMLPCHPLLSSPLWLTGFLCYHTQWRMDPVTSNAYVTHREVTFSNFRQQMEGESLTEVWLMYPRGLHIRILGGETDTLLSRTTRVLLAPVIAMSRPCHSACATCDWVS